MNSRRHSPARAPIRRGLSLAEVAVSNLLVGVLLVAALRSSGSTLLTQRVIADMSRGAWLVDALVAEIQLQTYMEPGLSISSIGREGGESGGSRSTYDDFDDYDGWSDSPPQNKDGTAIANLSGWQRKVSVVWVNLNDVAVVSATESGVKRATVTVSLNGNILATRVIIKVNGA